MPASRRLVLLCWFVGGCAAAPAPHPETTTPPVSTDDASASAPAPSSKYVYPAPRRGDVVDDYYGTKVADPYRWLEDPDAPETRTWIEGENKITFAYLAEIPEREAFRQRLTELWNYETLDLMFRAGGRYFFTSKGGLANQRVLYTMKKLGDEPRALVDPNQLSPDGTVSLPSHFISDSEGYMAVSPRGRYLAYALSTAGSDWKEWHVKEIDSGKDLPDKILWSKFAWAAWAPDEKGFYYSRFPAPNEKTALEDANFNNKVYFHRLGDAQDKDELIYFREDHKKWMYMSQVSEDGRYLIISVTQSTGDQNMVLVKDLRQKNAKLVELIGTFDAEFSFLGSRGTTFWFKTTLDAPRGRIIAVDLKHPEREHYKEVIPQSENALRHAALVGGRFVVDYMQDVKALVRVFDLSGRHERDITLPGVGSTRGLSGGMRDHETFFTFRSFTAPSAFYRYDTRTGQTSVYRAPQLRFDAAAFETEQVFFTSKDGTRIPMFIIYKKGMKRDSNNPTHLYGYGGFNISITPTFRSDVIAWLERGGVYAVPNLRGGGEYGEAWHRAGTKLDKQNVFDDFIGAAEWLIANEYTRPEKLAISGRSNGGLLAAACLLQRPDLFAAAVPGVGVLDMLRFHKFTIGWAWTDDYGSADDAAEFQALYKYSPYHNTKVGTHYPATLLITADHDDRVVPAHSFKFAAALQYAQRGDKPVLIRIETQAGHGAGVPTDKKIAELTDTYAFMMRELGMSSAAP